MAQGQCVPSFEQLAPRGYANLKILSGVRELTRKYWWAILLGTLGLIGIIVLLVVYGARYTGTDNPDGKPAKPLPSFCCCGTDQSDGSPPREGRGLVHSELREDKQL